MTEKTPGDTLTSDWFATDLDPARMDPVRMAQKALKPSLPARFYHEVTVVDGQLLLDGRPARTPAKNPLCVPDRAARALQAEWDAQKAVIDPATMPLTRLANAIIDGVLPDPAPVAVDAARYAASDLLCYRASEPQRLVEAQEALWTPVVEQAGACCGGAFRVAEGIGYVAQAPDVLEGFARAMPQEGWRIGAFHVITTLTGSALLALALYHQWLSPDAVWTAAHVDEDIQMQLWGRDEEALERRSKRRAEFDAAALILIF